MMGDLIRALVQGYTIPRPSMRRVLDGGHGLQTALTMVAAAYLIQAFMTILLLPGRFGLAGHAMAIMQQIVTFFLFSAIVWGVGRLAGGRGTMGGAQLVVGWHALVTSLISPLAIGAQGAVLRALSTGEMTISAGVMFLILIYGAVWFWLLANYVTELHAFRSVWLVLGAAVGLAVALVMLRGAIISAFVPA